MYDTRVKRLFDPLYNKQVSLREVMCGKSNGRKERTKEPGPRERRFRLYVFSEFFGSGDFGSGIFVPVGKNFLRDAVFHAGHPGGPDFFIHSSLPAGRTAPSFQPSFLSASLGRPAGRLFLWSPVTVQYAGKRGVFLIYIAGMDHSTSVCVQRGSRGNPFRWDKKKGKE